MAKRKIPRIAMEKILKSNGAERVSESAKDMLIDIIENKIEDVAVAASRFAKHAGRKTIREDDIELAFKGL